MSMKSPRWLILALVITVLLCGLAEASLGDRLPEFQECVDVCARENCDSSNNPTHIPFHHRLLLWTCPQECDYTCQHIITKRRLTRGEQITQFHGKWPFIRVLGMQEPFSVLFSLGNLVAHQNGLAKLRTHIPADYSLRRFYVLFSYFGMSSWIASAIFHCRDFASTEQLDYFAAGAAVLYGFYYTPIRIFRLDRNTPRRRSILRAWTLLICSLYVAHVAYLKLWRWNYTYNMTVNVVLGIVQNSMWSWYSVHKWRENHQSWAIWPGIAVAWIIMAMGLEVFDFPPWWGALDAHSIWHLGTIGPTILWYNFLVKDAQDDIVNAEKERLKS